MFQDSRTPLRLWFLAIELFVRTGRLNAKELQRAFGVTYKCAWRMKALICERGRIEPVTAQRIAEVVGVAAPLGSANQ